MKKLPDSELEIMLIIWDARGAVTSDYIMERIDRGWTKTTLLNLLSRLCERGFVSCTKEGRRNVYTAIADRDEYVEAESRSFLKKMYRNSLTKMVASLYDGKSVTKADLEELKAFIEGAEND